ncbi:hypothetical protein BESB_063130 [Besnoitia besnoiti]|uniref:Uncharacterized protein n=1 Tax=Besnoitia besnoiti TaxID=94643 RepID=A0A2A9MHK2_BESBE|nr:hypothetical protein BESB_063130 [Besnoitia besnoiti]PFH35426.1 hypothetical protein BESB_063130 [Besnoitia besnoiti]
MEGSRVSPSGGTSVSMNASEAYSGAPADGRRRRGIPEGLCVAVAGRSTDTPVWTEFLNVSIPADLGHPSAAEPHDDGDAERYSPRVQQHGQSSEVHESSATVANCSDKLARTSGPSEGRSCSAENETDGADVRHAPACPSEKPTNRGPQERVYQVPASACVSTVAPARVASFNESTRSGKSVGGTGRGRMSLGAVGRQLLLDRIRARYHTNPVYYSTLLRDKYSSTISKLPFFTVSLLHQLAADFGIDSGALLNYNAESVFGFGGSARAACGRTRGVTRTARRVPLPAEAGSLRAAEAVEFPEAIRSLRRSSIRMNRKGAGKSVHVQGISQGNSFVCRGAHAEHAPRTNAQFRGAAARSPSALCGPMRNGAPDENPPFGEPVTKADALGCRAPSPDKVGTSPWPSPSSGTNKRHTSVSHSVIHSSCKSATAAQVGQRTAASAGACFDELEQNPSAGGQISEVLPPKSFPPADSCAVEQQPPPVGQVRRSGSAGSRAPASDSGAVEKKAPYSPGTGSTESVSSSPAKSHADCAAGEDADAALSTAEALVAAVEQLQAAAGCVVTGVEADDDLTGLLALGARETTIRDVQAFSRAVLEQRVKDEPSCASPASGVVKGVDGVCHGTAADGVERSCPPVASSSGHSRSLKRFARCDMEAIEALLAEARKTTAEGGVSVEDLKSQLLLARLSQYAPETSTRTRNGLQATTSESTAFTSSPTSPTSVAAELAATSELWASSSPGSPLLRKRQSGALLPATDLRADSSPAAGNVTKGGDAGSTDGSAAFQWGEGTLTTGRSMSQEPTSGEHKLLAALSQHAAAANFTKLPLFALSSILAAAATGARGGREDGEQRRPRDDFAEGGRSGILSASSRATSVSQPASGGGGGASDGLGAARHEDHGDARVADVFPVPIVDMGEIESFLRTQRLRRSREGHDVGDDENVGVFSVGGWSDDFSPSDDPTARRWGPVAKMRRVVESGAAPAGSEELYNLQKFLHSQPRDAQRQHERDGTRASRAAGGRLWSHRERPKEDSHRAQTRARVTEPGDGDSRVIGSPLTSHQWWHETTDCPEGRFADAVVPSSAGSQRVGRFFFEACVRSGSSDIGSGRPQRVEHLAESTEILLQASRRQGGEARRSDLANTRLLSKDNRVVAGHGQMLPKSQRVGSESSPCGKASGNSDLAISHCVGADDGARCCAEPNDSLSMFLPRTYGECTPNNDTKSDADQLTNKTDSSGGSSKYVRLDQDSNEETSAGSPVLENAGGNNDDDGVRDSARDSPSGESTEAEVVKGSDDTRLLCGAQTCQTDVTTC